MRHSRRGKLVGVAACVAALVGLSAVVTGVFAQEPDDSAAIVAQAKKRGFVFACPQRRGHNQSKGDLNVRLRAFCARGQKPLKLATWPLRGKRGPQGPQGPPGSPGGSGGGGGSSASTASRMSSCSEALADAPALRPTQFSWAPRSGRPRVDTSASLVRRRM